MVQKVSSNHSPTFHSNRNQEWSDDSQTIIDVIRTKQITLYIRIRPGKPKSTAPVSKLGFRFTQPFSCCVPGPSAPEIDWALIHPERHGTGNRYIPWSNHPVSILPPGWSGTAICSSNHPAEYCWNFRCTHSAKAFLVRWTGYWYHFSLSSFWTASAINSLQLSLRIHSGWPWMANSLHRTRNHITWCHRSPAFDWKGLLVEFINHCQQFQPLAIHSAVHDKIITPDVTRILCGQQRAAAPWIALPVLHIECTRISILTVRHQIRFTSISYLN